MSSMHRTIEGDVLVHHPTHDTLLIDPLLLAAHGRSARTLVKEGPIRLTLMALASGGQIPTHATAGPVNIQVLDGEMIVEAVGQEYPLESGDLLVLGPGIQHSVRSAEGSTFLLTVVHEPSAGSPRAED